MLLPGSIPGYATLVAFLEQGTLLRLLQSTQLLKWGPGGLVPTGEAAHPTVSSMDTWGSKFQLSISHKAGEGLVGTSGAHTPSYVRHGTASCGSLVLPQEDMPALTSSTRAAHRCPSAGPLREVPLYTDGQSHSAYYCCIDASIVLIICFCDFRLKKVIILTDTDLIQCCTLE